VASPLEASDLLLQPAEHGQVLPLQEGHAPLHAGDLLLQTLRLHASAANAAAGLDPLDPDLCE